MPSPFWLSNPATTSGNCDGSASRLATRGYLFRTIFLIDNFTNTAFRHEMQHALNRGEAVHILQRAIHSGKIPIELARHDAKTCGSRPNPRLGVDPSVGRD
jgi:hypothetical protein